MPGASVADGTAGPETTRPRYVALECSGFFSEKIMADFFSRQAHVRENKADQRDIYVQKEHFGSTERGRKKNR